MTKAVKLAFLSLLFANFFTLQGYALYLMFTGDGELVTYENPTIVMWFLSVIVMFVVSHFTGCWRSR